MADRLFQGIADQIVALINEGAFPPGTRLPGERELAERFNVSRVTIREAAIALQAVGVLKIKTGSGIYVSELSDRTDDALPKVSALELTEARSLFESEAAALAAPVISDATLAKLDTLLEAMAAEGDDEKSTEIDREFHMTIASASGNAAITHVIHTLWRLRTELPEVKYTHESVCHHDGRTRQDEHAAVVEALRKHDPQGARLAMRQHFQRLLASMLDATEEHAISELRRKSQESRERFLISAKI
ncbi:DNA-binding FadR family transcriptional regulator [Novosphingobium sp. PhB57]|jgi:DNA-binding FadR family transcriptional regulator|uniref:FadR/GntR family transcriptional regulator n=1 Tax=unclassified Novosphingobium TaxID=2644732 RepID=UPI0010495866|nr:MULTISPECIES: FadR/GntR family transcriptional regulator [unclassified Novosphingobium]TCU53022.1 DNA-binding FadR family transcriptional regulator [Novosphingobium sp. PhB57]TDW64840.1 DNA-binding FadR family transcriptional regulator [Novosphingobium sp. PhB55]